MSDPSKSVIKSIMKLKCLIGIHEWNDFACNKCGKIDVQRASLALFNVDLPPEN